MRKLYLYLTGLTPGKWRYFIPAEMDTINQLLKNSSKTAEGGEGMDE